MQAGSSSDAGVSPGQICRCGKRAHDTKASASGSARSHQSAAGSSCIKCLRGHQVTAYHCPFGSWHVGHSRRATAPDGHNWNRPPRRRYRKG